MPCGEEFDLHELAVEDAITAHQRPKLEVYDDMVFVVYKTARYDEATETVEIGEVQMFVGSNYIIVVRHGEAARSQPARRWLEHRPELMRYGPAAVGYAVADRIVDDYAPVMQGLENDIREVELEVFEEHAENPVERIYKLKREVLELHRATAPMVPPLGQVVAGRYDFVPEELLEYYRDVQDHLLRVVEQIDTFRDLLKSVLEANLTRVSVRQNEDMRKISAWVAVAAVPTLVGGIYGMNFENMPVADVELRVRARDRRDRGGVSESLSLLPPQRLAVTTRTPRSCGARTAVAGHLPESVAS